MNVSLSNQHLFPKYLPTKLHIDPGLSGDQYASLAQHDKPGSREKNFWKFFLEYFFGIFFFEKQKCQSI